MGVETGEVAHAVGCRTAGDDESQRRAGGDVEIEREVGLCVAYREPRTTRGPDASRVTDEDRELRAVIGERARRGRLQVTDVCGDVEVAIDRRDPRARGDVRRERWRDAVGGDVTHD